MMGFAIELIHLETLTARKLKRLFFTRFALLTANNFFSTESSDTPTTSFLFYCSSGIGCCDYLEKIVL